MKNLLRYEAVGVEDSVNIPIIVVSKQAKLKPTPIKVHHKLIVKQYPKCIGCIERMPISLGGMGIICKASENGDTCPARTERVII